MTSPHVKKRKVDRECRQFNENWTEDYFFIPVNDKPMCLICSQSVAVMKEYNIKRHYKAKHSAQFDEVKGQVRKDISANLKDTFNCQHTLDLAIKSTSNEKSKNLLRASYAISEIIARQLRPLSDGEFAKECLEEVVEILCPEKHELFTNVNLSENVVFQRINKMADNINSNLQIFASKFEYFSIFLEEFSDDSSDTIQLAIFIRGVDAHFNIVEELLKLCCIRKLTLPEEILLEVKDSLHRYDLDFSKLSGITTSGDPDKREKNNALITLIKAELDRLGLNPYLIISKSIICHENICAKFLQMDHVILIIVSIMNIMRSYPLYHKEFKKLLDIIDGEYIWQSSSKVLQQFYKLRQEIKYFMEIKGKSVPELSSEDWLFDLAFMVDITVHLNELNAKLRGKDQLINNVFDHIKCFQVKLQLWESQLRKGNSTHFSNLHESITDKDNFDFEKYAEKIKVIKNEIVERFSELTSYEKDFNLFASPFNIDVELAPPQFQMEIIELQCDSMLKYKFHNEVSIVMFYKLYLSRKTYPNLYSHGLKIASIFTSPFICEQYFSKLKSLKKENCYGLSTNQLEKYLRVAISEIKSDISELIVDQ